MPRPISATIDLGALRHNLAVARRCAPRARAIAVIKANAYGHGLLRAAHAMAEAEGFGLLEIDGAVRLREAGFEQRIVLLEGCFDPRELAVASEYGLTAVMHTGEQVAMLGELGSEARLDVMLKVNTGMNRLGFRAADVPEAVAALQADSRVRLVAFLTHFANADDARGVAWQMEVFDRATADYGLARCLANSAAVLRNPETHCDWTRPGIMLYGCSPFAGTIGEQFDLRPAMTLESELIAIQTLGRGDTVGYGGLFIAEQPTRIGVVACGYADGYPRHAPNGTPVLVDGRLTGTVGRVSMDMLCVDLSSLPEAGVGSRVVLWGAGNPIEDVAASAGTVGYELMCALAARVPVREQA